MSLRFLDDFTKEEMYRMWRDVSVRAMFLAEAHTYKNVDADFIQERLDDLNAVLDQHEERFAQAMEKEHE